jgi:outer membrane protein TolC
MMTLRTFLFAPCLMVAALAPVAADASGIADDPGLQAAVRDALAARPELARDAATVRADAARASATVALPDPVLSVSYQNESFNHVDPGRMADSYPTIMLAQTLPTVGTRAARDAEAGLVLTASEAGLERTRLTVVADVRRAWVDLLVARARLGLLARAEALWADAEAAVRARYEAGQAPQSDLIRAQLQRTRLAQRRHLLEADEHLATSALNRLTGHAPTAPIDTPAPLTAWSDPSQPTTADAVADALARSPELRAAGALAGAASARVTLAEKARYPDLTLSAGLMPRWGDYAPMWALGLSTTLPVWSALRQGPAVDEATARQAAGVADEAAIRALLEQRVSDRVALLGSTNAVNRLYRTDLLVQSEAALGSALAQYRAGAVPFGAMLDAGAGFLSDQDAYLGSVAQAWRLAIELDEVRLDPSSGPVVSAGAGPSLGASGNTGGSAAGSSGM